MYSPSTLAITSQVSTAARYGLGHDGLGTAYLEPLAPVFLVTARDVLCLDVLVLVFGANIFVLQANIFHLGFISAGFSHIPRPTCRCTLPTVCGYGNEARLGSEYGNQSWLIYRVLTSEFLCIPKTSL